MSEVAAPATIPRTMERDLIALFEQWPEVERVWIFGSHARGDAHARSDVDLAVDAPRMDERGFADLVRALEGLLFVRKVDLVHWQAIEDPAFRRAIEVERRILWQREGVKGTP